jgi:flagellar basal-body rod protein FlgC
MARVQPFTILPRPLRTFMRPLVTSAEGMSREQAFLDVISANLANAEVTRTPEGGPYRRQVATASSDPATGKVAMQVQEDAQRGRLVYDPGHPDANAEGFVEYPNVDVTRELVDLMIVRRVHEANATVFQAAKSMLKRALDI